MLDVKRWIQAIGWNKNSDLFSLLSLLTDNWHQAFKNLYYYRISQSNFLIRTLTYVFSIVYRGRSSLIFQCENIGSGFFIQHGFSTIIAAKSIGENCWINQQVTIGFKDATSCPTIGNNVIINAGAKVIGSVTICDNVTVGANAVVVKNVPENCVVVGVPAYIVKKNGVKVKEQLV
ncbi:MAG: serine acetyltransferase [Rhizonema sp. PD37]|nr:serine acetyltransferase [Rhizonema sp. PD37]